MTHDQKQRSLKTQAFSLFNSGQSSQAKVVCQKFCKINPSDSEVWCLLCVINGTLGLYEESERCGRRAIDLSPNYVLAHFNLASALLEMEKTDEAIIELQLVIQHQPDHGMAHFLMGKCYALQAVHIHKAITFYEKALQLLPAPPRELMQELAELYEKSGETEKSRHLAEQIIKVSPQDPHAGLVMAKLEKRDGQLEAARNRLETLRKEGLETPRDKARVLNQLGLVLDRLGEYKKAYDVFEGSQQSANEMASTMKYNV
jgi:tetratricopeptide (TPR) repeat protein